MSHPYIKLENTELWNAVERIRSTGTGTFIGVSC